MLVARVVGQHLAARGALERLEAGLALDGLGGGVLKNAALAQGFTRLGVWDSGMEREESRRTYGFQLALCLLGTGIALAVALLLCSVIALVKPLLWLVCGVIWLTWLRYP